MDIQAHQEIILIGKALAHEKRLLVLEWLKEPRLHFPVQTDGSRVRDGVCSGFIAKKLGVSDATASAHLKTLQAAGLITPKRIGKWTFYKRDKGTIKAAIRAVAAGV